MTVNKTVPENVLLIKPHFYHLKLHVIRNVDIVYFLSNYFGGTTHFL